MGFLEFGKNKRENGTGKAREERISVNRRHQSCTTSNICFIPIGKTQETSLVSEVQKTECLRD